MTKDDDLSRAKRSVELVIIDWESLRKQQVGMNPKLLEIVNLVDHAVEGISLKEAIELLEILSSQIDGRIDNLREVQSW